ncbi:MAG: hypothetical protein IKW02_04380 [Clostridia bacterium]|nr:hypothetical protein [Clostridia bacterium]
MSIFNYPFFNKSFNITATINKKFLKNISVLSLALTSVVFSFLTVGFIFYVGLGKFVPQVIINSAPLRNMIISVLHTIASLFGIIYATFYIDRTRYDGKIVSPAVTSVLLFIATFFLAWRCYFANELDILVFIVTADGVMFSVFLLFLSILQYDIASPKTHKRYLPSLALRIFVITSIVLFIFSIFTYYDYFSYLLTAFAHFHLTAFQTDALVLFTFLIAEVCLVAAIVMMYIIERKTSQLLKSFTSRVRSKSQQNQK